MLKIAILEENSNWVKLNVINAETAQSVKPQSTADAHAHKEQHWSMAHAQLYAQLVSLPSMEDANAQLVNTWSMEDVRQEEAVFATNHSMKETTDVLTAHLVN